MGCHSRPCFLTFLSACWLAGTNPGRLSWGRQTGPSSTYSVWCSCQVHPPHPTHVGYPRLCGHGGKKPNYLNTLLNPGQADVLGFSTTAVVLFLTVLMIPLCYMEVWPSLRFFIQNGAILSSPFLELDVPTSETLMSLLSEKSLEFPEMVLSALLADAFILSSCVSK